MEQPSEVALTVEKTKAKQVLVGVRVSPDFHRRIHTECLRRDQSLRDLVTSALRSYFEMPLADGALVEIKPPHGETEVTDATTEVVDSWMGLWETYVNDMPLEKIEIMTSAMEWDLQMQKSSRRKSPRRRYVSLTTGERRLKRLAMRQKRRQRRLRKKS